MYKLAIALIFAGFIRQALLAPSLDSFLMKSLKDEGQANVVISMKDRTAPLLSQLNLSRYSSRTARLNAVASSLQAFAGKSQQRVLQALEAESFLKQFTFKSLWLTNQILIRNADLDLVQKLAAFDEILSISEEKVIQLEEPLDLQVHDNLPVADEEQFQWGVKQIEAPIVWDEGNRGENIVIATIDTGVRVTHEALRENYRQDYGWFEPFVHSALPNDKNGHGTHTTANIVGNVRGDSSITNIGVAPKSQWIACKACDENGSCFLLDLLDCAQWVACPTDYQSQNPDCSKAPHIVSNSWSGGRGSTWYADAILAWRAAGIIPLFAIGNTGPACSTASSPGDDPNVIGVGATTSSNVLASFSGVGPTYHGQRIKPDISAPGFQVFSAYHTSDTAYATMSGTSMACPHAAGTVALMLSTNLTANYETIKSALELGTVPTISEGKSCEGIPDTQFPNYHIGHGRINARQSINRFKRLLAYD